MVVLLEDKSFHILKMDEAQRQKIEASRSMQWGEKPTIPTKVLPYSKEQMEFFLKALAKSYKDDVSNFRMGFEPITDALDKDMATCVWVVYKQRRLTEKDEPVLVEVFRFKAALTPEQIRSAAMQRAHIHRKLKTLEYSESKGNSVKVEEEKTKPKPNRPQSQTPAPFISDVPIKTKPPRPAPKKTVIAPNR